MIRVRELQQEQQMAYGSSHVVVDGKMDPLSGKRIVILGLARQGEALARFAAEAGADVVVSDLRSPAALHESLERLQDLEIAYVLGEHPLRLLEGADLLAVSGGVPADAPLVQAARAQGIRITNDALEFTVRSPAPIIGITGSAGKTTTTSLAGAMSRAAGRTTWVGGNIGRPLIGDLPQMAQGDLVVQELSSFQLEIWSEAWGNGQFVGPSIAAVLNITPNHLDRHKTMEAYAAAKANLLRRQDCDSVTVLCADDMGSMALASQVQGRLRTFSAQGAVEDGAYAHAGQVRLRGDGKDSEVCQLGEIGLRGGHNLLNVLAAVTLADSAGIDVAAMRRAIRDFRGVAHRLEVVGVIDGVTYVNDSIATAPERALAGLAAFDEPLILLAGGRDKEMDWRQWAKVVARRVRHVVLFGQLAPQLEAVLQEQGEDVKLTRVETLAEAVECAARVARAGDVALLSPGGTSYDAYKDFEERGNEFRLLVRALAKRAGEGGK